jgi:hypothetical protein
MHTAEEWFQIAINDTQPQEGGVAIMLSKICANLEKALEESKSRIVELEEDLNEARIRIESLEGIAGDESLQGRRDMGRI